MLRLRAFRPSNDKIVRLQLHPTQPWLVTADGSDNVVVWDWEHRQVIYEVNAGGVDSKRLVGAQLQKLAEGESEATKVKPTEAIRGGSVKHVKFYDDDVRFWHAWLSRSAAAESPASSQPLVPANTGSMATRGRRFLVICCENKAIFLDLVTMRARDVPKQILENKAPLCVEFLPRSITGDGPFAVFGGSDGSIRVLSMTHWQMVQKYTGGHKGSVVCLLTFLSSSGETFLVSGASDGFVVVWSGESAQQSKELLPKLSIKAHDGGVYGIEMARVQGGAPQLVTIGADKTLAIWDTVSFKELKRIKPIAKVACHSVASWCHPRAPNLDILTCVKDSHIWAIEHATYMAMTRPLCDLSSQVPASVSATAKKVKAYCMTVHPLQPHLVATGTNAGVILSEFDAKSLPAAVALPPIPGNKEHGAVFALEKELRMVSFQLSAPVADGRLRDSTEGALHVKQTKRRVTNLAHDSYSLLSTSSSGKYVSVVWPDVPHFAVYRVSDWALVDSGQARHFAWDSCQERYALLEATATLKILPLVKMGNSRKAKEAAAQAAAAAAAAASAAAAATVEVRILLDDGSPNLLTKGIEGRNEQVVGLQGGALLGVAYRLPRSGTSIIPAFPNQESSTFLNRPPQHYEAPSNFVLYSWETFKPVSGLLPQPEWSAWDQTVEYCALAYQRYVVISYLRPQYRYLGNVAIEAATGGVWHRRQLFITTPTTIECVFVDAGVSAIDVERKRMKEESKAKAAQTTVAGRELALLTVDAPQSVSKERVFLRPPMLQVVRLASFQAAPSVPQFIFTAAKQKVGEVKDVEEKKVNDVAIGGGGVSVAVSRLPVEQKRPVGPLVVVGVRDGVLYIIDRFVRVHAIGLSHPGIRCRCLAAHGDAVSAVKWASRLGREHHDDLAQFMLGMGYATEALHLPGISKRLEFELAMQSNDLKRALQCIATLSNSKTVGQDDVDIGLSAITPSPAQTPTPTPAAVAKKEAIQGIVKFSRELLELVDAADATGQSEISNEALNKLSLAGAVEGALEPHILRGLALRLATHGHMTRLSVLVNRMIGAGHGKEAALTAALLGDPAVLENAWQSTGMIAQAALHAFAHGRASFKGLMDKWNQSLSDNKNKDDEDPVERLSESARQASLEIIPPFPISSSTATPTQSLTPTQPLVPSM